MIAAKFRKDLLLRTILKRLFAAEKFRELFGMWCSLKDYNSVLWLFKLIAMALGEFSSNLLFWWSFITFYVLVEDGFLRTKYSCQCSKARCLVHRHIYVVDNRNTVSSRDGYELGNCHAQGIPFPTSFCLISIINSHGLNDFSRFRL